MLGTCILWVKQGSVSLYGAILSASSATYPVYAPATHALPSIEAVSARAELELQSLGDGLRHLPYIGVRDIWNPTDGKKSACSFYVLGHSFEQDTKAPRRLKEMELSSWKPLLTDLTRFEDSTSPRILVCGRRSSGLSTLIRCLLNRFIAKQVARPESASHSGVLLLDLDTAMPEFVPPGMISLVRIQSHAFGPAFTTTPPPSHRSQVLRKHFLGEIDTTDLADWHLTRVHDLLDIERNHYPEHKGLPVIVIVPTWLNEIDHNTARKLWNKIAPADIICVDPATTSPHLDPWRSPAEDGNCEIHHLPAQIIDMLSPVREHDLQMQSYFHRGDSGTDCPFWDETPILAGKHQTATLVYGGDNATIRAIVLLGGHVELEDTYDALHGNIVAVVVVRPQAEEDLASEEGDLDSHNPIPLHDYSHGNIRRTEEDLPRWEEQGGFRSIFPYSAGNSFCLGLGIVQEIDICSRNVSLITGPDLHVREIQEQGYHVALVVPKATADGRFKADWAQREMHMRNMSTRK